MNTYYLRTIAADFPAMLSIGTALGALTIEEDVIHAPGGCWDFIGPINKPTGAVIKTEDGPLPVMAPKCDAQGNAYIHANLITPVDLSAGLANPSKFLLVDAEGNTVAPAKPHRVFGS